MPKEATYFGEDPKVDFLASKILTELRSFVDKDTIDGSAGIAWSWRSRLITLEDLQIIYERFIRMKDLINKEQLAMA